MHARVVTFTTRLDKFEALSRIHANDVIPALQKQEGFKGSHLLVDEASGKSMIVTLWDTLSIMKATEDSGWFRDQLAKFNEVFSTPPTRESYEVKVRV